MTDSSTDTATPTWHSAGVVTPQNGMDFEKTNESRTVRSGHPEMSTLHWLSPNESAEWDEFVGRHPFGLVYHLSSWQRVLERAFGHMRGRFLVLRNAHGQIKAGLPVYIVKSWLLGNRAVSLPFATMCDPLVSSVEEFHLLWPAIDAEAKINKCKRIEIRTKDFDGGGLSAFLGVGTKYKHIYLPLGKDNDALFRSFHESCIRRRIRKAIRENIVVEERKDDASLRAFHAMLVATRRRLSLPPMPFAFFEAMHHCLGTDLATLYLAVHHGDLVGGLLVLKFKDMWTAEYAGDTDGAFPGTNQLLYWEAIQRANKSGARIFSFGRTALDNASLLEYKRRWGTVEEDLIDLINPPSPKSAIQEESAHGTRGPLYTNTKRLLRYAPNTVQKYFGDFCYRHLG